MCVCTTHVAHLHMNGILCCVYYHTISFCLKEGTNTVLRVKRVYSVVMYNYNSNKCKMFIHVPRKKSMHSVELFYLYRLLFLDGLIPIPIPILLSTLCISLIPLLCILLLLLLLLLHVLLFPPSAAFSLPKWWFFLEGNTINMLVGDRSVNFSACRVSSFFVVDS